MAESLGKRRKMSYFQDLVDRLELGVADQVELQLVEELMSADKKDLGAVLCKFISDNHLSWEAVFSKYTTICSLDEDDSKEDDVYSSKEDKLVKQYYTNGKKLAPSAVTWNVLLRIGIVRLTAESFRAVASEKKQRSLPCQFDSGTLHTALEASVAYANYNEAYLSLICGTVIAHFTQALRSRFQCIFGYDLQASLSSQQGFPDAVILYYANKNRKNRKVLVVMEIKTNVPIALNLFDEADTKGLAQLVYTGHTYLGTQDFRPLLVLTNCAIWHFFELGNEACPQRYCNVKVDPPEGLPVQDDVNFDAVGVFSEIFGFIQRNQKHLGIIGD